MCDPVTLTLAVTVASASLSAYSQIQQGKSAAEFANYNAKQMNADANAERGAAQVEAERIRQAGKRAKSSAIAQLAGSGVDVNEGTALVIDKEIGKNAEQDAYTTILGGNDRALRLNAQASVTKAQGQQAKSAGYLGAGTTLLGAAGSVASGWKSTLKPPSSTAAPSMRIGTGPV